MKPDAPLEHAAPPQHDSGILVAVWAGKQNLLLATLGIYVLVLPVAHTIALRGLAFLVLLVLTLGLLVERKKLPWFPLWQAWLAYAMVGLIGVFLAFDLRSSGDEFRAEFLYCFAIFMVGSIWGEQFGVFKPFAWLFVAANLVLVSFALMFAGLAMPFESVLRIPAIAYAGLNTNWIVTVIFLHVWLLLHLWQEQQRPLTVILVGLIGLDVWAMMVGYNRQTWLALGIGISCWGLTMLYRKFSWRRVLALVFFLGAVAMLFFLQLHRRASIDEAAPIPGTATISTVEQVRSAITADPRWEIWRFSITKIAEHPLVGGGPGRDVFRKLYPEFHPNVVEEWHAHNMILNKGIQMGVPGMLTFLLLWLALARELVRHARASAGHGNLAIAGLSIVGTVFAKNMTDDFFVRDTALMFWLVMGLLIGVLRSAQSASATTDATSSSANAPGQ
jgi:O-antigen ligase